MNYTVIDCFDFTPTENYLGYREGDNFLLGIIVDGRLIQLFSGRGEFLSKLNELDISKFHPYQLEFLHYLLVDDKYPLSNDVLDYLVETGQVVQSWVDWYRE